MDGSAQVRARVPVPNPVLFRGRADLSALYDPVGPGRTPADPVGPVGPVGPSRTQSDPVGPSRTRSDPVGPGRTQSDPVGPSRTQSDPVGPGRTQSDPVGPGRTQSDPVGPSRTQSDPVRPVRPALPPPTHSATTLTFFNLLARTTLRGGGPLTVGWAKALFASLKIRVFLENFKQESCTIIDKHRQSSKLTTH